MADFTEKQRELRRKADMTKSYVRSRSAPKMETIHSRDEIRRELNRFKEINKYKGKTKIRKSLRLGTLIIYDILLNFFIFKNLRLKLLLDSVV